MSYKDIIKDLYKLKLAVLFTTVKKDSTDPVDSIKRNRGLSETKTMAQDANTLIDRLRKEGY